MNKCYCNVYVTLNEVNKQKHLSWKKPLCLAAFYDLYSNDVTLGKCVYSMFCAFHIPHLAFEAPVSINSSKQRAIFRKVLYGAAIYTPYLYSL